MKAVVLAGGKGTRLFPITEEIPKPMAPVAGKPMLQSIFELLADTGVDHVRVNACHLAHRILDAYGSSSNVDGARIDVVREARLMGTAGSVKRLARRFDETFVVVMGDALTDVDVREVAAYHKRHGALATLALTRVGDTSQYGVVGLDAAGDVAAFQEKPLRERAVSNLANTGVYVLEPEVLDYIPEDTFFDFAKDVFPRLLAAGERIAGYEGDFYWSDVGTLDAYWSAQRDALSGRVGIRLPGERRSEHLWMEGGTGLHQTATVTGRVVVGRNALVGQDAVLLGDTTVGEACRVMPGAMVVNSVLMPGCCIGRGASVEGCIVGPGYRVPAGERVRGLVLIGGARVQLPWAAEWEGRVA